MSALPLPRLLDRSVDLLDPYALEPGRDGDRTDPVRWTQDPDGPLNGIVLDPPADWQPGDPPYEAPAQLPGPQLVRKKSLAEHVDDVEAICNTLESLDAEELDEAAREELAARLLAAIVGTKAKIDSTCRVLAMLEADDAAMEQYINEEKARIAVRREKFAKRKARLESYVLRVMEESGQPRMDGYVSSLTAKKNPAKLTILDQSLIPKKYFRQPPRPPKPPRVPDNALIKDALKANTPVPGCRLDQGKRLERS